MNEAGAAHFPERRAYDRRDDDRHLPVRMAVVETTLNFHLQACEKRGARLERIAWLVVGLVVTLLSAFIKVHIGGIAP